MMFHYRSTASSLTIIFSLLAAATTTRLFFVHGEVSEQCRQETDALRQDAFLDLVQGDLYDSFLADFNDMCEVTKFDCSLKFDGNNRTYVAACEDKGGQISTRDVILRCGVSLATFNWDLGVMPTCIGRSCNASAVEPRELNDTRAEQFLQDLKVTGCDADFSAAAAAPGSSFRQKLWGILVVGSFVVGMIQ